MARPTLGRGTLLNTATVALGAGIGALLGPRLPDRLESVVLAALGLVTLGLGIKLFLGSRNILIVGAAMALGGTLGSLLHFQDGIVAFGEWAKAVFGGGDSATFAEGVVTASILFCVGPMTLMGCLQEAVEGKIDLIAIKSTLDGFAALFLAAVLGPGVLVSAGVVFVVQGALTLLGSRLHGLAANEELVAETTAVGGPILMAIALGLLELRKLPTADYLPALILAPLFVAFAQRLRARRGN